MIYERNFLKVYFNVIYNALNTVKLIRAFYTHISMFTIENDMDYIDILCTWSHKRIQIRYNLSTGMLNSTLSISLDDYFFNALYSGCIQYIDNM